MVDEPVEKFQKEFWGGSDVMERCKRCIGQQTRRGKGNMIIWCFGDVPFCVLQGVSGAIHLNSNLNVEVFMTLQLLGVMNGKVEVYRFYIFARVHYKNNIYQLQRKEHHHTMRC